MNAPRKLSEVTAVYGPHYIDNGCWPRPWPTREQRQLAARARLAIRRCYDLPAGWWEVMS